MGRRPTRYRTFATRTIAHFTALRAVVWALDCNATSAQGGSCFLNHMGVTQFIPAGDLLWNFTKYAIFLAKKMDQVPFEYRGPAPLPILSWVTPRNISGTQNANNGPLRGKYLTKKITQLWSKKNPIRNKKNRIRKRIRLG